MDTGPLGDPIALPPLRPEFYADDALKVARRLLGKVVVRQGPGGVVAGRIVEVEAYRGPEDRAAHSYGGRRTPRNEAMWGPPGRAYVVFTYGMHWCLNAVTAPEGCPEAVLLRALEPLAGLEVMRRRRPGRIRDEHLLRGPANLCRGLGVDGHLYGVPLWKGPLTIREGPPVRASRVRRTPRIGVASAGKDALRPWRLYVAGSPAVSGPRAWRE